MTEAGFPQIAATLHKYTYLIVEQRVLTQRQDNQLAEYKARLTFTDGSVLEFSEILVLGIQKRKYAFQWMTASFDLLLRWDNALHHRHIPTFPHHKHVGNEQLIEASEEVFLEDVLQHIAGKLAES